MKKSITNGAIFLAIGIGIVSLVAQEGNPDMRWLRITEGDPSGTFAYQGDLVRDKSSAAFWTKSGGDGTNSFVALRDASGNPVASTANVSPVAGSIVMTTNGFKFYLTATNGLSVTTATNVVTTFP